MFDKMHSGEIYNPSDPKVMLEQMKCLNRLYKFNKTKPYQYWKRMRLLKKMFADIGDMCYIEPPLRTNWGGKHIHFGNGVYCNFGPYQLEQQPQQADGRPGKAGRLADVPAGAA